MSLHEQFDRLARQKLEERVFPFDEGAWLKAQREIAAQSSRRRRPIWYFGGVAAVGLALWLLWPDGPEPTLAQQQNAAMETVADGGQPLMNDDATMEHSRMTAPVELERADQTQKRDQAEAPASRTAGKASKTDIERHPAGLEPAERTSDRATADQTAARSRPDEEPEPAALPDGPAQTAGNNGALVAPEIALVTPDVSKPTMAGVNIDQASATDDNASGQAANVDAEPLRANVATAFFVPVDVDGTVQQPKHDGGDDKDSTALDQSTAGTEATSPDAVVALKDTTVGALGRTNPAASSDTAAALPEPVPAPLVGVRSPWELSMLAGAFNTASRYTLPMVKEWSSSPDRTPGFAAEAVRLGRNFGYGFGLHYGTYADHLSTPEETRADQSYSRYWFLQNVDTTILIITGGDSASGYTGINVNTTLQVLRSAYDTTTTVTVARTARTQLIRTSYVEVPLLLDAHLIQGRWSMGLRGGPTVGMLTARSGALPGNGEDGYADLSGMAVRQTVFGWTARAYVRYRFNSAWSLGIEPGARGQFTDAIDDQGARRRSNALGAMISLSYRLR